MKFRKNTCGARHGIIFNPQSNDTGHGEQESVAQYQDKWGVVHGIEIESWTQAEEWLLHPQKLANLCKSHENLRIPLRIWRKINRRWAVFERDYLLESYADQSDRTPRQQEVLHLLDPTSFSSVVSFFDFAGYGVFALKLARSRRIQDARALGSDSKQTLDSRYREYAQEFRVDFCATSDLRDRCRDLLIQYEKLLGPMHADTIKARSLSGWIIGQPEGLIQVTAMEHADWDKVKSSRLFSKDWEDIRDGWNLCKQAHHEASQCLGRDSNETLQACSHYVELLIMWDWAMGWSRDMEHLMDLAAELRVLREEKLGKDHPDSIYSRGLQAYCSFWLSDRKSGLSSLREASENLSEVLGPESPESLRVKGWLAACLAAMRFYKDAERAYEQIYAQYNGKLPIQSPRLIVLRYRTAAVALYGRFRARLFMGCLGSGILSWGILEYFSRNHGVISLVRLAASALIALAAFVGVMVWMLRNPLRVLPANQQG